LNLLEAKTPSKSWLCKEHYNESCRSHQSKYDAKKRYSEANKPTFGSSKAELLAFIRTQVQLQILKFLKDFQQQPAVTASIVEGQGISFNNSYML